MTRRSSMPPCGCVAISPAAVCSIGDDRCGSARRSSSSTSATSFGDGSVRSTCCPVAPMTVRRDSGAPLLTYALVAPALRGSGLARVCVSVWQHVDAAHAQSLSMARLRQAWARVGATAPAALIAYGAWIVAIAAATNVVMLTTVERYHYPRRT